MADLIRWFKDRKEEVRDIFDANTQADQQRRMAQGQPRLYQDQQTQRAQPVQRPAPNVQQPQAVQKAQAPSYGSGVSGALNRVRDVLDANTQQDIWKRNQQAMKDWKAPMLAPKLNQSYKDEQLAMGNKRPYQNIGATLAGNTARFINTGNAAKDEVFDTANLYAAQALKRPDLIKTANERIQRRQQQQYKPDSGLLGQGTIFDKPQDFNTMGAAEITKRIASTAAGTGLEVAPISKGAGVTSKILAKAPNPIARAGIRGIAGAAENATQDVLEQQITRDHYSPLQTLSSAAFGAVLPNVAPALKAGSNVANRAVQQVRKNIPDLPIPTPRVTPLNEAGFIEIGRTPKRIHPDDQAIMSDFIDMQRGVYKPDPKMAYNLELDASRIAERYGLQMPNTPTKLANVFDKRLQNEQFSAPTPANLLQRAKDRLTPLDEGGFVQLPGKQDPLIQEYADTLQNLGEGNGVSINKATGTRMSNNYRSADLKGKRMTKADWYAEAERQINAGKADPAFMDYYKQMNNPEVQSLIKEAEAGKFGKEPLGEVAQQPSQSLLQLPSQTQKIPQSLQRSTQGILETPPVKQTRGLESKQPQLTPQKGGLQDTFSSNKTIQNVDDFVKEQVAKQEVKPKDTTWKSRLKRTWIDTLSPAEDTFRNAVKEGKLSQETLDEIVVKNGKSLRSGTMANINLVDSGLVDLLHKKSKADYDALGQTLIAIHSNDLKKFGIETGRNADIDNKLIQQYGKKFEADIRQFRDASNFVLDRSVESQLISKETAELLRKKYPNYVPMNRVIEELQNTGSFGKSQVASIGKQSVVKKIKGSKRVVENPLESMISKVQDMTQQSLRNEAGLAWVDALKETGDAKLIAGKVEPGQSTISVLRNGKKEIYAVEPEMEAAAKGLTKPQMGIISNAARKVSRVFKTGTTGVNLPFIVTNLARDQQNALLNQQAGELNTFKAIPGAIMETLGHKDLYNEAVRQGAISTSFDLTKPNLKRTAENIRKKGASLGTFEKIEDAIGRSEEYTRIQQYKATKDYWLKKGLSEEQAMNKATLAAQQNSADFARSGDLGSVLNAWLPYTNAGVQGTRATLRAAKNNPTRYATKAGAMLIMPTIMTALWNTSDDERKAIYDDISEFEKQSSTIIVTPWAKKSEDGKWQGIVKIPKPPGISALLYPVEKGVASMKGLDPVGFDDIAQGVLGFASPLGDNLKSAASTITPQAIKPVIETTFNKNLFTGRDVVPQYMTNKPSNEQAYTNTSGTARLVGKFTNTSPLNIEHLIKGYGGEVGLQGLNAIDNALAKTGAIPQEQVGGRSIPRGFTRRFSEAYDAGKESKIPDGAKTGSVVNSMNKPSVSTKPSDDLVAGIKSSYGGKFAKMSNSELEELAKTDADAKDYMDKIEGVKRVTKTADNLPSNISEDARKILDTHTKLSDDGRKKWGGRASSNTNANNEMLSWLPQGVQPPQITNEITKKWADYKKKEAEGSLANLEAEKERKSIMRSAYNSVLNEDEKDLYSLSKEKLQSAYDRGLINDENISKALAVEKRLYDAGLIDKESLARKLNQGGRGYKTAGGSRGSRGRGGKGKQPPIALLMKANTPVNIGKPSQSKLAKVKIPSIPNFAVKTPRVAKKSTKTNKSKITVSKTNIA